MVNQLYYSEIHLKNIEIYLSKLYFGTYYECHVFLCDEINRRCMFIDTFLGNFLRNGERKRRMKRNIMVQWTNLHRSNSFVNRTQLPLFCEISGAVHLALVGLTAGRLADKIQVNFKFFKNCYSSKYLTFHFV